MVARGFIVSSQGFTHWVSDPNLAAISAALGEALVAATDPDTSTPLVDRRARQPSMNSRAGSSRRSWGEGFDTKDGNCSIAISRGVRQKPRGGAASATPLAAPVVTIGSVLSALRIAEHKTPDIASLLALGGLATVGSSVTGRVWIGLPIVGSSTTSGAHCPPEALVDEEQSENDENTAECPYLNRVHGESDDSIYNCVSPRQCRYSDRHASYPASSHSPVNGPPSL